MPRPENSTFGQGRGPSRPLSNAMKNGQARKKMTLVEEVTGMTADELAEQQRQMKADCLRRMGRGA